MHSCLSEARAQALVPQWVLRPFWAHERSKLGARYATRCLSESCLSESCLTEASSGIYLYFAVLHNWTTLRYFVSNNWPILTYLVSNNWPTLTYFVSNNWPTMTYFASNTSIKVTTHPVLLSVEKDWILRDWRDFRTWQHPSKRQIPHRPIASSPPIWCWCHQDCDSLWRHWHDYDTV